MTFMRRGTIILSVACLLPACQASVSARGSGSAAGSGDAQGLASGDSQPGPGGGSTTALGECPKITGNAQVVTLPAGTCTGDLKVSGSGHSVTGAGKGKTIVEGRLLISGSGHSVSGLTVMGEGKISGLDNNATGVEFRGSVDVSGRNNMR